MTLSDSIKHIKSRDFNTRIDLICYKNSIGFIVYSIAAFNNQYNKYWNVNINEMKTAYQAIYYFTHKGKLKKIK